MEKNFRFWMPLDVLEKSGTGTGGVEKMKVGGIASTSKKDLDGESLDPNGFDLSYFKNKGIVNWNHNKSPDAIIGEPSSVKLTKEGLYVEAELYADNPLAKSVFALAQTLQKSSKTRRLGFSIEGKATERDPDDDSKVSKALITNIALTISPKNPDSIVNIVKGNFNELSEDDLKPYSFDSNFDGDFEIEKLNKLEKALNTSDEDSGKPLIKESVEGNVKNQIDDEEEEEEEDDDKIIKKPKTLSKSEVISSLMKIDSVITFEKATGYVEILNNLEMAKDDKTNITSETLEKALGVLGLKKSNDKDVDNTKDESAEGDIKKAAKTDADDSDDVDDSDEEEDNDDFKNLKKSIDLIASENIEMFKGVGTLLKGIYDLQVENKSEIADLKQDNFDLKKSLEEFGGQPIIGRKSTTRPLSKSFEKGFGNENDNQQTGNILSVSQNKPQVLSLLDNMAFEKGFNPELAKAMTVFESSGHLSAEVAQLIKSEKNITLVK
jgi:hypothetical protein